MPDLRTVDVLRYVQPLREGGSLPAIVEADDGFPYVIKFRGAGQGQKALVAELIGGELARSIGLRVPELVFMQLDESFSKTEPDQEIQDLLRFSVGLNLGLHFLSGAITYDPAVTQVDALTASKIVLLDSLLINIDRTPKNTNLIWWKGELWLIDHGAALYFHHNWQAGQTYPERPFGRVSEHVLLAQATALPEAAADIRAAIDDRHISDIVAAIPDEWLVEASDDLSPDRKRAAYHAFLTTRLDQLDTHVKVARNAR